MLADSYLSEGGVPRPRRRVQERWYYVLRLIKERGRSSQISKTMGPALCAQCIPHKAEMSHVAMQLIYNIIKNVKKAVYKKIETIVSYKLNNLLNFGFRKSKKNLILISLEHYADRQLRSQNIFC